MATKNTSKGKGKGGDKGKAESKPATKGKGKPVAGQVKEWKGKGGVPISTKISAHEEGRFASVTIFGHPLAQVLRALGKAGHTAKEVRGMLDGIGLTAVRQNTVADKVGEGRAGDENVVYAPISKKELAVLVAAAPKE